MTTAVSKSLCQRGAAWRRRQSWYSYHLVPITANTTLYHSSLSTACLCSGKISPWSSMRGTIHPLLHAESGGWFSTHTKPLEWKARDTATTVENDDDVVSSPSINNKELFPFQQDGVRFLLSKKRCILADEVSPKRRGYGCGSCGCTDILTIDMSVWDGDYRCGFILGLISILPI